MNDIDGLDGEYPRSHRLLSAVAAATEVEVVAAEEMIEVVVAIVTYFQSSKMSSHQYCQKIDLCAPRQSLSK